MRRKPDISGKRRSTAIRSPTYTQVLEDCSDALPSQPSAMVCLTLPNETLLPPNSSALLRMLILTTTGCMKKYSLGSWKLWGKKTNGNIVTPGLREQGILNDL